MSHTPKTAIIKDCSLKRLNFDLPIPMEYHSCSIRHCCFHSYVTKLNSSLPIYPMVNCRANWTANSVSASWLTLRRADAFRRGLFWTAWVFKFKLQIKLFQTKTQVGIKYSCVARGVTVANASPWTAILSLKFQTQDLAIRYPPWSIIETLRL